MGVFAVWHISTTSHCFVFALKKSVVHTSPSLQDVQHVAVYAKAEQERGRIHVRTLCVCMWVCGCVGVVCVVCVGVRARQGWGKGEETRHHMTERTNQHTTLWWRGREKIKGVEVVSRKAGVGVCVRVCGWGGWGVGGGGGGGGG